MVVGIGVIEHHVTHALAGQLLGQSLHGVQVHTGGDEVDAQLLHLCHLWSDSIGKPVAHAVVEVRHLGTDV